ncbi:MAG: hypothetical protein GY750_01150 [Lentisphaerae bacterium]|nr:hypothetical protein [Lentisphaerota bacterium]MCP4100025.1 hypothetical protein [Lentisphaerota bacterium]
MPVSIKKFRTDCDYLDLKDLPDTFEQVFNDNFREGAASLAVGDLHGNAYKLYYLLLSNGYCFSKQSTQLKIYRAYHSRNYKAFEEGLKTTLFNKHVCRHKKLILLGDTLCDRGRSDYMTLLLFEKIAQHGVNLSIVISNHDMEFIYTWSNNYDSIGGSVDLSCVKSFDYKKLPDAASKANFDRITTSVYMPRLKVIELDYTDGETIVYSHTSFNMQALRKIYSHTVAGRGYMTLTKFPAMVRAVNNELQKSFQYRAEAFQHLRKIGVEALTWNRDLSQKLPNGYIHVFGHNLDKAPPGDNQYNLDSPLGQPHSDTGTINYFLISPQPEISKFFKKFTPGQAAVLRDEFEESQLYALQEKIMNAGLMFRSISSVQALSEAEYDLEEKTLSANNYREIGKTINRYFSKAISLKNDSYASFLLDQIFQSRNIKYSCPFRLPPEIAFCENNSLANVARRDCASWLSYANVVV